MMNLIDAIRPHLARAIDLRHRLHQVPELCFQENLTAALIRKELDDLSIGYLAGVPDAPTATIAHLGDQSRPCVALRADIDGLPIAEQTGLPYASTRPGHMHACGHDGHAATLLLAAAALRAIQHELPVCVKLIWQPAEEGGGGARRLVAAGLLDGRIGPKAVAIFGLHGWPVEPLGMILTRPGPMMAASDTFTVTFRGKGAHAARPQSSRDPVPVAAQAILSLQQIVSREIDPAESCVITIGKLQAGTATNIIPDIATIAGTVRTLSPGTRALCRDAIERRCAGIAAAGGCTIDYAWNDGYPVVVNVPAMARHVAETARQTLGPDRYAPLRDPSLGAEDFAYYLQQIPGCFFRLGLRPPGYAEYPGLHNDHFDFPDAALEPGALMFLSLLGRYPARQSP